MQSTHFNPPPKQKQNSASVVYNKPKFYFTKSPLNNISYYKTSTLFLHFAFSKYKKKMTKNHKKYVHNFCFSMTTFLGKENKIFYQEKNQSWSSLVFPNTTK